LAKAGKTAKARERYQEIIKQFPKTQAALRAKEKLEKLKK
jgi:TolA-binding protein